MKSEKIWDFLTPSPLSAFRFWLYYKIHATSLTSSAFGGPPPRLPLPPSPVQTLYLHAPLPSFNFSKGLLIAERQKCGFLNIAKSFIVTSEARN